MQTELKSALVFRLGALVAFSAIGLLLFYPKMSNCQTEERQVILTDSIQMRGGIPQESSSPHTTKSQTEVTQATDSKTSRQTNPDNDLIFSKNFPAVMQLMKTRGFFDDELVKKIDALCLTPPSKLSFSEFKLFQNSISNIQNLATQNDTSKYPQLAKFIYSFVELSYYVSNATGKSAMVIMIESISSGNMMTIDVFKIVELVQRLLDFQLILMLVDKDTDSRYRALVGLDRITENNTLGFSKKWTEGNEVRGIEVMTNGTPIRLDTMKSALEKMSATETSSKNKQIISKIQNRLNRI